MKVLALWFIRAIISLLLPCSIALLSLPLITKQAFSQEASVEVQRADAARLFQEGIELRRDQKYIDALEKFQAALSMYEDVDDREGQADTLNQIGNVYLSLNQHDQASDYYQLALELRQQGESVITSANPSLSVGSQHSESITFQPADISFPGNRTSPASRGTLLIEGLTALVPETNYGRTTKSYPTIFIYLPEKGQFNQDLEISFHLIDEQDELMYTATRAYPQWDGILGISFKELENINPLEVGKQYQWYISVNSDSDVPSVYLSGWIHRVESTLSEGFSTEASLEDQLHIYAGEGIWYDMLATLFELKRQDSENSRVITDLQALLKSVGLRYIDVNNYISYWSNEQQRLEVDEQQSSEIDENSGSGDEREHGGFRPPSDVPLPGVTIPSGHR